MHPQTTRAGPWITSMSSSSHCAAVLRVTARPMRRRRNDAIRPITKARRIATGRPIHCHVSRPSVLVRSEIGTSDSTRVGPRSAYTTATRARVSEAKLHRGGAARVRSSKIGNSPPSKRTRPTRSTSSPSVLDPFGSSEIASRWIHDRRSRRYASCFARSAAWLLRAPAPAEEEPISALARSQSFRSAAARNAPTSRRGVVVSSGTFACAPALLATSRNTSAATIRRRARTIAAQQTSAPQ